MVSNMQSFGKELDNNNSLLSYWSPFFYVKQAVYCLFDTDCSSDRRGEVVELVKRESCCLVDISDIIIAGFGDIFILDII